MAGKHRTLVRLDSSKILVSKPSWVRLASCRMVSYAHLNPVLDSIIDGIRARVGRPAVPSVHGSRTAMMRRISTATSMWIQGYVDTFDSHRAYSDKLSSRDDYGNIIRFGTLDFHNCAMQISEDEHVVVNGRILVEIVPVLEHYLQAGKIRRALSRWFPKLISTRSNKFTTTFSLKLRFWLEPGVARETEICSITVADCIVPPKYKSRATRRFLDNEKYRFIASYFRSIGSLRISKTG